MLKVRILRISVRGQKVGKALPSFCSSLLSLKKLSLTMHCNALLPSGSLVCVHHLENVTEKIPEIQC